MRTHRSRLAIVAGTTMALVLTGASIVTAQTPDLAPWDGGGGITLEALGRGGMGGRGPGRGFRAGDMAERLLEQHRQLVRQEVTLDLGDDGGIVVRRVEHGTVAELANGSLTLTLVTGEVVTVATDEDTDAVTWDLDDRPFREEAALTDVVAGAEITVWSESQEDGTFLASRVAILPEVDATPEEEPTDDVDTTAMPDESPATVG